jgi:hypothetical protein
MYNKDVKKFNKNLLMFVFVLFFASVAIIFAPPITVYAAAINTVTKTDVTPGTQFATYKGILVYDLHVANTGTSDDTITSLSPTPSGSADDTLVTLHFYLDTNHNGFVDQGDTDLLASAHFASDNTIQTFNITGVPVSAGGSADILITAEGNSVANNTLNFTLSFEAGSAILMTVQPTGSFPLVNAHAMTITTTVPSLTIADATNDPAPKSVAPGASNVTVKRLAISAAAGTSDSVVSLAPTPTGTANDNLNINSVAFYIDNGTPGVLDGADVQLSTLPATYTSDDARTIFTFLSPFQVAASSTVNILVVYNLNAGITPGSTLYTDIAAVGDVIAGSGTAFNGDTSTTSSLITIASTTATLTLATTITNNNGGTRALVDFPLTATGPTNISGISGAGTITGATVTTGTYTLSETTHSDYTAGVWSCTNSIAVNGSSQITLTSGQSTTCTIINDDIAPVLHLRKTVDITGGGTALDTAWTLTANGALSLPTNLSGTTPVNSDGTFKADTYTLAESGAPSGYTASLYSCAKNGTGAVSGNSIILALGDIATCTITNTFVPATTETITVIKLVVGGTKGFADFPLFVNGSHVASSDTNSFPAPATYTVTETSNSNYAATFSGLCPGGVINLALGTPKVCTITNTYTAPPASGSGGLSTSIPPLIDLVKVPSPLALPGGPGPVTYTYTLRNIGTVPVSNITLVGDTCSPITLISGDTNANLKLEVNETWVYRCTTTLSKTHTNTVVATGWANGISATDIASATVVVGASVVPPLIHVTKIPNPLALPAGGGAVTYTYTVTNPGTVPLSNVSITDDKCTGLPGRVSGHPGDLNKNNLLETNEVWKFTCQTNLTQTTTNTGTAEGSANGLTARDFAITTVVVANTATTAAAVTTPMLPKTGFPPEEKNSPWNYIVNFLENLWNLSSH